MIGAAAAPASFPVGWYGKIPVTGDFIARRLATAFSEPWDRWLQGVMDGSRERLGARWRDTFLSMPAWRFILAPGMVTPNAWAGLMVPSVDAVVEFASVTETVPSEPMVMFFASAGMTMFGVSTDPSEVTIRPVPSFLKAPARVYATVLSARWTWKKPSPSITRSSGFSVCWKSPWLKIRCVAIGREPRPTWMPVGMIVPCVPCRPGARNVW